MTDLVERLRGSPIDTAVGKLDHEAADEMDRLRQELDFAWAAGLFEGEGCISGSQQFKKTLNADGERRKSGFRWAMTMNSTDHDVLRRFHSIVKVGSIYGPYKDKRRAHYKPQWQWYVGTLDESQHLLRSFLPYLGERRRAKALLCIGATNARKRST